jgi:rod shape-determining protein MreC
VTATPDRSASRWDTFVFAVCILLSIVARSVPPEWVLAVSSGVRTLAFPLVFLQHQTELTRNSRALYGAVVRERDSVALVADSLAALRMENEQLRGTLGLRGRLGVSHVPAEVLHQALATDGFTLTLSVGRTHGVRPLAPVVAPGGLVGVVTNVDARTSVMMTWKDPEFRASAMTADGSVFGIVAPIGGDGPNEMFMELSGVPYREHVPAGTAVYTSGLGGVYPRGIRLGRIIAVAAESEGWSRTYLVLPAVHPAAVSHVMILLGTAPDLSASFPGAMP